MLIKIMTVQNKNPGAKSPYFFRNERTGTVDEDAVVDIMAQGRTTLSKPDILACLQLYHEEVSKLLADGYFVKTKLGAFFVGVSGTAQAENEAFRCTSPATDHDLHIHFRPNPASRAAIFKQVETQRTRFVDKKQPRPTSAVSLQTNSPNTAGPGDLLEIRGHKVKFDPQDPRTGVFYRDSSNNEVRAEFYVQVKPSRAIVGVPKGLKPGTYRLAVRTVPNGKDVLEGLMAGALVVFG